MINRYDFTKLPSILIQGAMEIETDYLIERLVDCECVNVGNWKFYTGFLGRYNEPVIISRTYQGMVNASAATSLALTYFNPKIVINQGIGGGHDPKFHKRDIVLGERVVPMGAIIRGFSEEGAGINETDFVAKTIEVFNSKTGKTEKVYEFPCDKKLVALAETVETSCFVARGTIGSADEWNNQIDRIALLRGRYHTAVEDMETAAAAQICLSYNVPFIGIRIISNSIVNGEEFDKTIGLDGQKFIESFVETLHKLEN